MQFLRKIIYGKLSDEELISKYVESLKPDYVGELFSRYSQLVYGVCLKYLDNRDESKDAVMNIFERLMETLKYHQVKNFRPWLYQVSRNHCLMILRSGNRTIPFEDYHVSQENEELELDTILTDQKDPSENLQQAVLELNEEQRICIDLFYLKGKSYKEICDSTGFTELQVKSYIQNGKRNLKNKLSNENQRS
jgi:RNA polymerase sigma-70 factor (ECF subfamily)